MGCTLLEVERTLTSSPNITDTVCITVGKTTRLTSNTARLPRESD